MSQRMENAPLYYAVTQAHFNEISAMHKYVAEVQDQLRLQGYTRFEVELGDGGAPVCNGADLPPGSQGGVSRWFFTREDRRAGFVLDPSFLCFQTTDYATRRDFLPPLVQGLEAVHSAAGLAHVARLGMRYLNAVLPKDGEGVEDYLDAGLRGVPALSAEPVANSILQFEARKGPSGLLPQSLLAARVYQAEAPLGYPAGVTDVPLEQPHEGFAGTERRHAVIDLDHYAWGRFALDFGRMEDQLQELHTPIRGALDAVVTDHARKVWG